MNKLKANREMLPGMNFYKLFYGSGLNMTLRCHGVEVPVEVITKRNDNNTDFVAELYFKEAVGVTFTEDTSVKEFELLLEGTPQLIFKAPEYQRVSKGNWVWFEFTADRFAVLEIGRGGHSNMVVGTKKEFEKAKKKRKG